MAVPAWIKRMFGAKPPEEDCSCPARTSDQVAEELDKRQHEVARKLHVLEYETSEAVLAMRRSKELAASDRRNSKDRKGDRK